MNSKNWIFSFCTLLILIVFAVFSQDDRDMNLRTFKGVLLDVFSGGPISGVFVRLEQNFGGQFKVKKML